VGSSNTLQKKKSTFILPKERGKRWIISSGPNVQVQNSFIGASSIGAVVIALVVNKGKAAKVDGSSNKMFIVWDSCEYLSKR